MSKEIRNFSLQLNSLTGATYQKLYQPGKFPGTVDAANRTFGFISVFLLKVKLPTARVGTNGSGRNLKILLTNAGVLSELLNLSPVASSGEYFYNCISAISVLSTFPLSADAEIGIQLFDVGYGLLSAGEQIDVIGSSLEDVKI